MIKNIEILEDLGLLDNEQKNNTCWKPGTISGSRVARIMNEPVQVLAEWLGDVEPEDPASNPIVKEKMEIGTYMEDVIINLAKQKFDFDIQIDKNTYKFKNEEWYFNIDGISQDGSIVYEVKNTETTSVDTLVERYKWQATWYRLMTGCDKVIFLFFIRGYKLRFVEYIPTETDMMDVITKCQTIIQSYNDKNYDLITWGNEQAPKDDTKPIEINDQIAKDKLNELISLQDEISVLEDKVKELKEYFGEAIGEKGSFIDAETGNKVSVVNSVRKGAVDVEKTLANNPGLILEYKKDYNIRTIKVTKKGKK